jgi:hypothetical protein
MVRTPLPTLDVLQTPPPATRYVSKRFLKYDRLNLSLASAATPWSVLQQRREAPYRDRFIMFHFKTYGCKWLREV